MASLLTTAGRAALLTAATSWGSATIKVALLRPGYTPTTSDSLTAATAYEVTGTGYTAGYGNSGRKTLASKTVTAVASADEVRVDAADLTWSSLDAGAVGYAALLIESGGSDVTSVLIGVLTLPVAVTDGSDFPVEWPASGLFVA